MALRLVSDELVVLAGPRQLFVDDHVVDVVDNVTRVQGQIRRENGGLPVLVADRRWERPTRLGFYLTTLWDADDGRFKMWYCAAMGGESLVRVGSAGEPIVDLAVGYAESEDGLTWVKPALGLYHHDGVDTNVVLHGRGFSCFRDPTVARGSSDAFKAAFDDPFDARPDGGDLNAAVIARSPDGFAWTAYNDGHAVTGRAADTQNQLLWDPLAARYLLIVREDLAGAVVKGENRGTRIMAHAGGNDLDGSPDAWTTLAILRLDRDGRDDYRRQQIHAFTDWIHEGVHLGFIGAMERIEDDYEYVATPADLHTRHEENIVEFYVATSRDASNWDLSRAHAGQPLIPRGAPGSWDKDGIHAPNLITREDRHLIYYCGMSERFAHGDSRGHMGVGLASIQLDRFAGMKAHGAQGTVVTKPFRIDGDSLEVNVDASHGEIAVEVLDGNGAPIPRFAGVAAARWRSRNEVRLPVRWDGAGLAELRGQVARLRFLLSDATIYAFDVAAEAGSPGRTE